MRLRRVSGKIKKMGGTYNAYTMGKISEDLTEIRKLGRQIIDASNDATKIIHKLKTSHDPDIEKEWQPTMDRILGATKQINHIIMEKQGRFK